MAIQSPRRWIYSEDGCPEEAEGTWKLPEVMSSKLVNDARQQLPYVRQQAAPADEGTFRNWLMALGPLVASTMTAEDARFKVNAFCAAMPEIPARGALTRETLFEAAKEFKWWPSFSELWGLLEKHVRKTKDNLYRVEALANHSPESSGKKSDERPLTTEERAAMAGRFRQLREALEASPGPEPRRR